MFVPMPRALRRLAEAFIARRLKPQKRAGPPTPRKPTRPQRKAEPL